MCLCCPSLSPSLRLSPSSAWAVCPPAAPTVSTPFASPLRSPSPSPLSLSLSHAYPHTLASSAPLVHSHSLSLALSKTPTRLPSIRVFCCDRSRCSCCCPCWPPTCCPLLLLPSTVAAFYCWLSCLWQWCTGACNKCSCRFSTSSPHRLSSTRTWPRVCCHGTYWTTQWS